MECLTRIKGQEAAVAQLTSALKWDQLSHAYLFTGPAGVGKSETALALAADILSRDQQSAGAALIKDGVHPDLLVMSSRGKTIRIDDIREMQEWLYLKPYLARRRVVIIRNAEVMSRASGNALLKVLEEPPDYAVIILVASGEISFPTILSRVQPIKFQPLPEDLLVSELRDEGAGDREALLAARLSGGSRWRARKMIELGVDRLLHEVVVFLAGVRAGRPGTVIFQAEAMEKNAEERALFFAILKTILRDLAVGAAGETSRILGLMKEDERKGISFPLLEPGAVLATLEHMERYSELDKINVNQLYTSLGLLWRVFATMGQWDKEGHSWR